MIEVKFNTAEVLAAMDQSVKQASYALMQALNKTAEQARGEIQTEMKRVFDRPTPWAVDSLRIKYAQREKLIAAIAYKDKNSVESSSSMIEPHVNAGQRHFKGMEARLNRAGFLPAGWNAVPGAAAQLDSYGNMSKGQITQLLNVLGTYTEAGYNKANSKTVERLAKGNAKKNIYGFAYFVNRVGNAGRGRHLAPGVYQRVVTGHGSSLKPVLMFVKRALYKPRLDFYGIGQRVVQRDVAGNFRTAFEAAMRTARPMPNGSPS